MPGDRIARLYELIEVLDQAEDPLTRLDLLDNLRKAADGEVTTTIADARSQGRSWTAIGRTLGVSRQAAWKHFHPPRLSG